MGIERESKVMGVTKQVFVTPWENRRIAVNNPLALSYRIDIPRPAKLYRLSIGFFIVNYSHTVPTSADNFLLVKMFDTSGIGGPSSSSISSGQFPTHVLYEDDRYIGTGVSELMSPVKQDFFPDGLLFDRGQGVTLAAFPSNTSPDATRILLNIWYRYENWS